MNNPGEELQSADTPVIQLLTAKQVPFECRVFNYIESGGTKHSSASLQVSEHEVVKTLVFESGPDHAYIVLMHGDCRVDTKALADVIGVKKVKSCSPETAEAWSGWKVGSTNPFILKHPLPIFAEASIFDCPKIWINGGGRGILICIEPKILEQIVPLTRLRCKG